MAILCPLLEKNRAWIQAISSKTFQFGPTNRHKLDIYYPQQQHGLSKSPILFFIYGGSFNSGARNLPEASDLIYANLGSFFARHGIITVIADYRLAPEFKFPQPVEDIRDAISWVVANPQSLVLAESPAPDLENMVVMGHSAGATHAATLLLYPPVVPLESTLRARIRGLVLISGGYDVSAALPGSPRAAALEKYWRTLEEAKAHDALTLLQKFPESSVAALPKVLMVQAEEEPVYLDAAGRKMKEELAGKLERGQRMVIAKGHNHISIIWALGTGDGEQWASEVAGWILGLESGTPINLRA
ncbi:alpha/beta hydrolase domain-containing protein [Coprinopsis sp. MPI-PUGE-AT-0042]|nr:alpha/beta hydrolase domain-containing protein [Coprinopsis sp. MPI-PUGE-AT-0042]